MLNKVNFRDKRLSGTKGLVSIVNTFELDASISIFDAFSYLSARKQKQGEKLQSLNIRCHGFGSKEIFKSFVGGGGLQLGTENLTMSNVILWGGIRDLIKNIVVYACSPAETAAGTEGTISDGQSLMKMLASFTNATVYASEDVQTYNTIGIDFGSWEGIVFQFTPDQKVKKVPGMLVKALASQ